MRIYVRAKLKAHKLFVQKVSEHHYSVGVREEPQEGKANTAIIEQLAKYFNIPKSNIILESGHTSSHKVFDIET